MITKAQGVVLANGYEAVRNWSEALAQLMREAKDAEIAKLFEEIEDYPESMMNQRNNDINHNKALNAKLKNRRNHD